MRQGRVDAEDSESHNASADFSVISEFSEIIEGVDLKNQYTKKSFQDNRGWWIILTKHHSRKGAENFSSLVKHD